MKSAATKLAARTAASPLMTLTMLSNTALMANPAQTFADENSGHSPRMTVSSCCRHRGRIEDSGTMLAGPGNPQDQKRAHLERCCGLRAGKVDKETNPHETDHGNVVAEF